MNKVKLFGFLMLIIPAVFAQVPREKVVVEIGTGTW